MTENSSTSREQKGTRRRQLYIMPLIGWAICIGGFGVEGHAGYGIAIVGIMFAAWAVTEILSGDQYG